MCCIYCVALFVVSYVVHHVSIYNVHVHCIPVCLCVCVCLFVCLFRVTDRKAKNKMTKSNLVSLFAPTLMTVNADAVSLATMRNICWYIQCM